MGISSSKTLTSSKSSTSVSTASLNTVAEFQRACLKRHNELRALHGCPPLELSEDLSKISQEWAKKLSKSNVLEHRQNSNYGENLYMSSGQEVDGKMAPQAWYDEIKDYDFENGGFSTNTGHFTQLVWTTSKKIGVGYVKKQSTIYVVVNYDPPGNYEGQYAEHVPKVIKEKPTIKPRISQYTFDDEENEALHVHNKLRARHGCPPLTLSRKLCEYSHDWAVNLANRDTMEHQTNSQYGENLYMACNKANVTPESAIQRWYDEIKVYNFKATDFALGTGHFTQIVWKNSKELGFAIVTKDNKTFVVANYDPPGNIMGHVQENVPMLLDMYR